MVTRSVPGFLLGLLVVAGTVAAALAVRPRAGRMIFPVPALAYLVAALISGIVFNRSAASSKAALAIGAAQWVAGGFFAMVLATVLAVAIITARWYLWRRGRPVSRDPDWAVPAVTGPAPTRAGPGPAGTMSPVATGPVAAGRAAQPRPPQAATGRSGATGGRGTAGGTAGTGVPGTGVPGTGVPGTGVPGTGIPGTTGPRGPGPADPRSRPRPGPPGSEPYNFSSGA